MAEVTLDIHDMHLKGTSQYQNEIGATLAGQGLFRRRPIVAELIPEPFNQHDPNAVRVTLRSRKKWRTVGYLAQGTAANWHAKVAAARAAGDRVIVPAKIIGGTRGKSMLGVVIGTAHG